MHHQIGKSHCGTIQIQAGAADRGDASAERQPADDGTAAKIEEFRHARSRAGGVDDCRPRVGAQQMEVRRVDGKRERLAQRGIVGAGRDVDARAAARQRQRARDCFQRLPGRGARVGVGATGGIDIKIRRHGRVGRGMMVAQVHDAGVGCVKLSVARPIQHASWSHHLAATAAQHRRQARGDGTAEDRPPHAEPRPCGKSPARPRRHRRIPQPACANCGAVETRRVLGAHSLGRLHQMAQGKGTPSRLRRRPAPATASCVRVQLLFLGLGVG